MTSNRLTCAITALTALAQADILQLWQHAGSDRLHHDTDLIKQLLECILVTT